MNGNNDLMITSSSISSLNNFNMNNCTTNNNNNVNMIDQNQLKKLYEELAEKEQALLMAAQFGKNLIDEKEDLERQIENMKRDHLVQVESLEQEIYQLKRQIESLRNEYETKIYELNEDIILLNKKLKQKELQANELYNNNNNSSSSSNNKKASNSALYKRSSRFNSLINNDMDDIDLEDDEDEYENLIQELSEKNQKLVDDVKASEIQLSMVHENCQLLECKLAEKENAISDDAKLISSLQKELNKFQSKQQELEFVLLQTCSERDKQSKIIDELSQKFLYIENEKNDLEHLIYQHETEIFNLQRINQDLLYKIEKFNINNNNNNNNLTNNNNSNFLNISNNQHLSLKSAGLTRKRRSSSSLSNTPSHPISVTATPQQQANVVGDMITSSLNNDMRSSHQHNDLNLHQQRFMKKIYSENYSNGSYFDSEFDDVDANNDLDMFRINEIEQDDDDEDDDGSVVYIKNGGYLEENDLMDAGGAVNWLREVSEQRLIDEDSCRSDANESDSNHLNQPNSQHTNDSSSVDIDLNQNQNQEFENGEHLKNEDSDQHQNQQQLLAVSSSDVIATGLRDSNNNNQTKNKIE